MQIYTSKHKYSFQYHFIRNITRNTEVNSSIRTENIKNVKTKIICEIFELSTCNPSMCMYIYPSVWGNLEKYCKTITTRLDLIISKSAIIYCWYFAIRASFNEFEGRINLLWAISYSRIYIWEHSWHKRPAYTCTTHGSWHILRGAWWTDVAFVLTDLHGSYFKIYSNCRDIWRSKCVFHKSDQDTSLSHAAISN